MHTDGKQVFYANGLPKPATRWLPKFELPADADCDARIFANENTSHARHRGQNNVGRGEAAELAGPGDRRSDYGTERMRQKLLVFATGVLVKISMPLAPAGLVACGIQLGGEKSNVRSSA